MAALGTFTLDIDVDFFDGQAISAAKVDIRTLGGFINDPDGGRVHFQPMTYNNAAIPFSVPLYTDVATGGDPSTTIQYTVTVTAPKSAASVTKTFAARAAGSTLSLAQVPSATTVPVANLTDLAIRDQVVDPTSATARALSASYAHISDIAGNPLTGKRVRFVFLGADLDDIVMEDF